MAPVGVGGHVGGGPGEDDECEDVDGEDGDEGGREDGHLSHLARQSAREQRARRLSKGTRMSRRAVEERAKASRTTAGTAGTLRFSAQQSAWRLPSKAHLGPAPLLSKQADGQANSSVTSRPSRSPARSRTPPGPPGT